MSEIVRERRTARVEGESAFGLARVGETVKAEGPFANATRRLAAGPA